MPCWGRTSDTGEASLTYTWAATTVPSGATAPTLSFGGSSNGTNAAKNAAATLQRGRGLRLHGHDYGPGRTDSHEPRDRDGEPDADECHGYPVVDSPSQRGGHRSIYGPALDQFGNAMTSQPTFTWTTTVAGGTINSSSGLFTAPETTASGTVKATSGSFIGSSTVSVTNHAPTVPTPASATPSPVTGTTTALSVLGADQDTGESSLTYTWAATTLPNGAAAPTFSVSGSSNGTNAAKNATATFSAAGTYVFTVTIADPGGLTATSTVTVTVNQTLTASR